VNPRVLVLCLRDLSERHPEMRPLRAWELQWTLFALGYVNDLLEEEISAAIKRLRGEVQCNAA
jgi:hypothetical protein